MKFVKDKILKITNGRWIFLMCITLFFIVILKANVLTPMVNEDFDLYAGDKTVGELVHMCAGQYMRWNARIGDVLSLIFSFIDVRVYNVANAFFTLLFILTNLYVASIIFGKKVKDITLVVCMLFVFLSLIFFVQKPGEIFLWRTGSANYMYPALFGLWFFVPFLIQFFQKKDVFEKIKNRYIRFLFSFIYASTGMIVAHANENTSPVFFGILVLMIVYIYVRDKVYKYWMVFGSITYAIGSYLLIFGPSTTYRIKYYAEVLGTSSSPSHLFLTNFTMTVIVYFQQAFWLLLILFVLCIFFWVIRMRYVTGVVLVICGISFLVSVILAASPYQEPRAFFMSNVLLIVAVVYGIYHLTQNAQYVVLIVMVVFVAANIQFFVSEYKNMQIRHAEQNQRLEIVRDALHDNSGDVTIPGMSIASSRLVLAGGSENEAERMMRYFRLNNRKIIIQK